MLFNRCHPPPIHAVDSHCHILPGLDDGPTHMSQSIAMARSLLAMGVHTVVATPHVISDIYPTHPAQIESAAHDLRRALDEAKLNLEVLIGAEYYLEQSFTNAVRAGEVLAWGPQRSLLFEFAPDQEPRMLPEALHIIQGCGYEPVLAHAERYRIYQKHPEQLRAARARGLRLQVNYGSFTRRWRSKRRELACWLQRHGLIDYYGTDMHRPPASDSQG